MNKYDKKILELTSANQTIHELIRKPIRSGKLQFFDTLFNNVLWVADGFSSNGAYYLIHDGKKAELVNLDSDLRVSRQDITNVIERLSNKNSFELTGHRYKLYRKIK